jgi:hypothetical protein
MEAVSEFIRLTVANINLNISESEMQAIIAQLILTLVYQVKKICATSRNRTLFLH